MLGPVVGTIFSVGLLASSLSSTSVGTYAGSEIMKGLLRVNVPMWACRVATLVPALVVLALANNPTEAPQCRTPCAASCKGRIRTVSNTYALPMSVSIMSGGANRTGNLPYRVGDG